MAISKHTCFAIFGFVIFLTVVLILALIPVYMRSRRGSRVTVVISRTAVSSTGFTTADLEITSLMDITNTTETTVHLNPTTTTMKTTSNCNN